MKHTQVEQFLRTTLETLESKTAESLVNPGDFNQELATAKTPRKTTLTKEKTSTSVASVAAAAAAAAIPSLPVPLMARIDDDLEHLVLSHFQDLKKQGDAFVDSLVDPYEQELDVYTTLSPFALVQSLFSNMTPEQIESVLEQHHYNIEDTMDSLFAFEGDTASFAVAPTDTYSNPNAPGKGKSKQVCRHFLLGQCYRSDCWYSHDPDLVLCKFWLKGRCYKGDSCEFSHGQALDQIALPRAAAQAMAPAQSPPSMEEFPALGGSPAPRMKKMDFWAPSAPYNAAAKKPPTIERVAGQLSGITLGGSSGKATVLKNVDAEWVSTGDALGNTYLAYRKDAIEAALNRNRLFQQATQAYLSGNKAAARALSMTAHQLNSQVSSLHQDAARSIFVKRNTAISTTSPVIDLHGLHASEAIDLLEESLKSLAGRGYRGKVVLVTGTGHHSRGRVKVLPAIRQHLEQTGRQPKDASLSDGRGGMLLVCQNQGMIADDDVPPLEDMSDYLQTAAAKRTASKPVQTPKPTPSISSQPAKAEKQFAGMAKGFFASKPKKAPAKTAPAPPAKDVPFLRGNRNAIDNPLEIQELKDKMASQFEATRNEWMTPAFLAKIDKSPVLSKAFQDPRFLAFSQELAGNPIATMQKVAQQAPEYLDALREFSGLIGEAMEEQANRSAPTTAKDPPLDEFEQGLVDKVLSDQAVQNALRDPEIQQLLFKLKNGDPSITLPYLLRTASPAMKAKIQ
ncbi:hypothetical protein HDU91_007525, partial [Kappamyces sp. JEL0680]